MGMFDSVYARVKCPVCSRDPEVEIQFKPNTSRYSPQCSSVRVGDRLPGFPAIPYVEDWGCVCFACECQRQDRYDGCVVVMERGVVTRVVYPIPEDHEWPKPQRGKNTDRRERFREEEFDRDFAAYQKKMGAVPPSSVEGQVLEGLSLSEKIEKLLVSPARLQRVAFAMARPLMRSGLDYSAIGEAMTPAGKHPNHIKGPDGKWRRRKLRGY